MSCKSICDICKKDLNVDNIVIEYKKIKAKKHAFDGWSSTYNHNIDVCHRCVAKIEKMRAKEND